MQPVVFSRPAGEPASAPDRLEGAALAPAHDEVERLKYHEVVLGPGDVLKVTVWGYPELSESVTVLPDGTVSYPLAGAVQAQGLNAQSFADAIRQALEPHIAEPRVSVVISQMRSRSFSVLGDVQKAGVYPLWGDSVNILESLAQAGGMTATAVPTEVQIFRRQGEGPNDTERINVASLLNEAQHGPLPVVRAGDVVFVPGQNSRRRVCVLGEVRTPGLYPLTSDMTVIEALTAAGWVKSSGILSSVMIVRRDAVGGARQFYRVDAKRAVLKQDWEQHVALQPGDVVYVPEHFIAKVGDFVGFFSAKVEPAAHAYLRVYDAANPANVLIDR